MTTSTHSLFRKVDQDLLTIEFRNWSFNVHNAEGLRVGQTVTVDVVFSHPTGATFSRLFCRYATEFSGRVAPGASYEQEVIFARHYTLAAGREYVFPYTFTVSPLTSYAGQYVKIRPGLVAGATDDVRKVDDLQQLLVHGDGVYLKREFFATGDARPVPLLPLEEYQYSKEDDSQVASLVGFAFGIFLFYCASTSMPQKLAVGGLLMLSVAFTILLMRYRKWGRIGLITRTEGMRDLVVELDLHDYHGPELDGKLYFGATESVELGETTYLTTTHPTPVEMVRIAPGARPTVTFRQRSPEPAVARRWRDVMIDPTVFLEVTHRGAPYRFTWRLS